MKAVFNSKIECLNWTNGKEYETKPSFVVGYVLVLDDNGAEQLIRKGDSDFLWVDPEKKIAGDKNNKT